MTSPAPARRSQAGVGLLEVLIAVLIMAIGLLGIAALQAVTLKNTGSSAERTNAVIQTYAMLDTMRANRNQARSGAFDTSRRCDQNSGKAEVDYWIGQLKSTVGPTACGRIDCGTTTCEVEVDWDESRATGGVSTPHKITSVSRL